ncbi:MAG: SpoIID/LytB domain-containing protein [Cyanophyceae cyanobacterium]
MPSTSLISIEIRRLLLGKQGWWSLLLWFVLALPAQAAVELKVAIKKNVNHVKIGSSTTAIIKNASGQQVGKIAALDSFSVRPERGALSLEKWRSGEFTIEPTGEGRVWIGDRWYRGKTRLVRHGAGVTAVNHVDLEEYLYSVVGAEAIPSWPEEALKAQAVAARTYALRKRSESKSALFDLDTTTKTQVYRGLDSEYTSTLDAVKETEGEVITHNGEIILAVFHSSSGGHTENVEDIWSSPLPYLRGVIDYDQEAPVFQWSKSFSAAQMSRLIGGVGQVQALVPVKVTPRGRVVTMKIVGDRGTKQISGSKLRQILELRSTLFRVNEANGSFQIQGRGFGHGIGMSQWGAHFLSSQGRDYQQILSHYYQNVALAKME